MKLTVNILVDAVTEEPSLQLRKLFYPVPPTNQNPPSPSLIAPAQKPVLWLIAL